MSMDKKKSSFLKQIMRNTCSPVIIHF